MSLIILDYMLDRRLENAIIGSSSEPRGFGRDEFEEDQSNDTDSLEPRDRPRSPGNRAAAGNVQCRVRRRRGGGGHVDPGRRHLRDGGQGRRREGGSAG